MQKKSSVLAVAAVCMFLAFCIALQFKSILINDQTESTSVARAEELQNQLSEERQKNESLYDQILSYQKQVEALTSGSDAQYVSLLKEQLAQANLAAGLTDVQGPGVVVTLKDSTQQNTGNVNENYYLIHDEDILNVVNELRDAGAEALSINGERILATTEFRCSGSVISVNNNRHASPFVIQAIGSADDLYNALHMRSGVVDSLAQWGITVDVKKKSDLTIQAYQGTIHQKYAKAKE